MTYEEKRIYLIKYLLNENKKNKRDGDNYCNKRDGH